jgi:hypothetical protein
MHNYPVHTLKSAPEASKQSLETLQSAFGFIPNIGGAMSTSPVLINSLLAVFGNVHGGSFPEPQIQTILLTNAVTNASTQAKFNFRSASGQKLTVLGWVSYKPTPFHIHSLSGAAKCEKPTVTDECCAA